MDMIFGAPKADRFQRTVRQEVELLFLELHEANQELSSYDYDDYLPNFYYPSLFDEEYELNF